MPFTQDIHARTAKPRAKPYRMSFGDGLLLDVRPSKADPERGVKAWLLRYMLAGRRREMGLGPYPEVGLAEARERAQAAKAQTAAKVDPIAARDAARREQEAAERRAAAEQTARKAAERAAKEAEKRTFRAVAEALLENQSGGWTSDKTRASWRLTLDKWAYPAIGDVPIAQVTKEHVTSALAPIWTTKLPTARKLQRRISAVLDYAAAQGWRVADNPAAGRVLRLTRALPAVAKRSRQQASLPWQRVPAFLAALDAQEGASALALRFAILTAVRSNEVRQARWSEVDLRDGLWTIPAHRMKGGKAKADTTPHRVPLTDAMLDVLARAMALRAGPVAPSKLAAHVALAGDGLIFPNQRDEALSDAALGACIKRMNSTAKPPRGAKATPAPWRDVDGRAVTAHGFRRAFRTWVDDERPQDAAAAEKALAHDEQNKVSAAYRGSDLLARRRDLMAAWSAFCCTPQTAAGGETKRRGVAAA